jgi:hypothetical protein
VINKEMQQHLGLTDAFIEVEYHPGCIVLRAPAQKQSFDDALNDTVSQFPNALQALAK